MRKIEKGIRLFLAIAICFMMENQFYSIAGASAKELTNGENNNNSMKEWSLDIIGFNYTNRVIESFSVNGEGAGNILLSSRTSGGGKSVCCLTVSAAAFSFPRIRVRWQVDGCTYRTRSKVSGEIFENVFPYYKQADVALNFQEKIEPRHLEVHFYPDGTVSAQLTESISLPRVLLDGRRSDTSNFPRCPNDKKPN